ncbi:MAG: hypothetical protein ACRDH9_00030 [Actinomycetota bacterium]
MPANRTAVALACLLMLGVSPSAAARPADDAMPVLAVAQILASPTPTAAAGDEELAALAGQRYPYLFPRSNTDRPDEVSGRQIHVVYVVPAAMPDDQYDELGVLEDSVRSMNVWMKQQTGNQEWVFDTYTLQPAGSSEPMSAIDVSFLASDKTGTQLSGVADVQAELIAHGFDKPNKRYLSYVASNAGGVCGDAWYPLDQTPTPVDGQYSDIYLYSSEGCRAREFAPNATTPSFTETIAMQEMIHNDAMVPLVAPHDCLVGLLAFGHVCTGPLWAGGGDAGGLDPERFDVMFPYVGLPLSQKTLDADHLDYYRQIAPYKDLEQGLYLRTI